MRWLVTVVALAGCADLIGLKHVKDAPPDAEPDVDAFLGMLVDAGPCAAPAIAYGHHGAGNTGLLSLCLVATPGARTLGMQTIDTDVDTQCDEIVAQDTVPNEVCVITGQSITVNGPLETRGVRPLVLVAESTLLVTSEIDLAARVNGTFGAGSNFGGCGSAIHGPSAAAGGGGGAGGSFGTKGGRGGPSAANATAQAREPMMADRVRGGCPGGRGGTSLTDFPPGLGGGGGGGLYLIAAGQIELGATAVINASGGAGRGGNGTKGIVSVNIGGAGGGAGGSGGFIGLDAPSIIIDPAAILVANGGGGGAGGGLETGSAANGSDPNPNQPGTRAAGGIASSYGGAGGAGAAGDQNAGVGTRAAKSGGGGGGGHGVIWLFTPNPPSPPTKISPAWLTNG